MEVVPDDNQLPFRELLTESLDAVLKSRQRRSQIRNVLWDEELILYLIYSPSPGFLICFFKSWILLEGSTCLLEVVGIPSCFIVSFSVRVLIEGLVVLVFSTQNPWPEDRHRVINLSLIHI